ncbi:glycosyltransferase family 39 protein [Sporolactobacillus spathodeae]|uniref:4-amino-4-deoxy-L-arabinose transferase-like glycosyltransferase n=1 Tax=Sporolactobacillus spathodeae TaxID=1465502 RepID=A0ABS2QA29_9BACL|nr:4-amino-4-deoxy-L-arabinose transferase-like glycosyltransferase [Sporolactobacillus spathodeae]
MQQLLKKKDGFLILIVVLSLVLDLSGIWTISTVNSYYMAAVISMMKNAHNFFFASFDPAGFVSIDKPPLAFWIQILFAKLFGVHGWTLILPQALAETGSVLMIYFLVKPAFGVIPARLAALLMTITPVAVAVSRTNNVDSILVFTLLTATLFLFKSVNDEKRQNIWLMLAFAFIGLGFNIKMMQAYLVLPAFLIFYFLSTQGKWWKKVLRLMPAILLMVVLSLAWALTVDAISPIHRPYVGSSQANSVTDLAFGYNGTQRLIGQANGNAQIVQGESSTVSPLRLFRVGYGTQIGWLMPLGLLSIPTLLIAYRKKEGKFWFQTKSGRSFVFWFFWFVPSFIIFSFAGFFHRYYFIMLAPSLAVLCAVGFYTMFQNYKQKTGFRPFVLPISLTATFIIECVYVSYYYPKAGLLLASAGLLLFVSFYLKEKRLLPQKAADRPLRIGPIVLFCLLLLAPAYWSFTPALYGGDNIMPEAGPQLADTDRTSKAPIPQVNGQLLHYLMTHEGRKAYLFATTDAPTAAPYIIKTQKPVMAIGGFNGTDPILNTVSFKRYVASGKISYFFFPGNKGMNDTPVSRWIRSHGKLIPKRQWAGRFAAKGSLYQLRANKDRFKSHGK